MMDSENLILMTDDIHGKRLFPCNECGKTFGSHRSQRMHVRRIHTGEHPYGCHFCSKEFADSGSLRKHERIHTGHKPYGCSACPRSFTQRVHMREHIRCQHSGLKDGNYLCIVCSATLPSSEELMQHLIKHSDISRVGKRPLRESTSSNIMPTAIIMPSSQTTHIKIFNSDKMSEETYKPQRLYNLENAYSGSNTSWQTKHIKTFNSNISEETFEPIKTFNSNISEETFEPIKTFNSDILEQTFKPQRLSNLESTYSTSDIVNNADVAHEKSSEPIKLDFFCQCCSNEAINDYDLISSDMHPNQILLCPVNNVEQEILHDAPLLPQATSNEENCNPNLEESSPDESDEPIIKSPVRRKTLLEIITPKKFKKYLRFDETEFQFLLNQIQASLTKDSLYGGASPGEQLAITLRFLATGNSFVDLGLLTSLTPNAIAHIVKHTCHILTTSLKQYIKWPTTVEEWLQVASGFYKKTKFPHCIGAVDGKHITLQKPSESGYMYKNYKGTYSILLMAIVDSNSKFLMVNVAAPGGSSDGGVFSETEFYKKLESDKLNLPEAKEIFPGEEPLPYVLLGDRGFKLSKNLMKIFPPSTELTDQQRFYNKRHCSARVKVENAFAILCNRFNVFYTTMRLSPEDVRTITLACCCLHNFLKCQDSTTSTYASANASSTASTNASTDPKVLRTRFCEAVNKISHSTEFATISSPP